MDKFQIPVAMLSPIIDPTFKRQMRDSSMDCGATSSRPPNQDIVLSMP